MQNQSNNQLNPPSNQNAQQKRRRRVSRTSPSKPQKTSSPPLPSQSVVSALPFDAYAGGAYQNSPSPNNLPPPEFDDTTDSLSLMSDFQPSYVSPFQSPASLSVPSSPVHSPSPSPSLLANVPLFMPAHALSHSPPPPDTILSPKPQHTYQHPVHTFHSAPALPFPVSHAYSQPEFFVPQHAYYPHSFSQFPVPYPSTFAPSHASPAVVNTEATSALRNLLKISSA